jgi:hypothetical protein
MHLYKIKLTVPYTLPKLTDYQSTADNCFFVDTVVLVNKQPHRLAAEFLDD